MSEELSTNALSYIKRTLQDRSVNPHERGQWEIYGEDPNCDLGGYHHEPLLAVVAGCYDDAVIYATALPRFFQWGGGGRIKRAKTTHVINLDTMDFSAVKAQLVTSEKERAALTARRKELERELAEINRKL